MDIYTYLEVNGISQGINSSDPPQRIEVALDRRYRKRFRASVVCEERLGVPAYAPDCLAGVGGELDDYWEYVSTVPVERYTLLGNIRSE